MSSFQGTPNLAQLFTEIKEVYKTLDILKEDINTTKVKLSKYRQLPTTVHEAKIVINEAVAKYKNEETIMKNILEENRVTHPIGI